MPDREKVIIALEFCILRETSCRGCPYEEQECTRTLKSDVLSMLKEQEEQIKNRDESLEKAREEIKWLRGMLKEQEADKKDAEYMPMEVVPVTIGNDYRTWVCSACGSKLHYGKELICPKCHRKIDWECR